MLKTADLCIVAEGWGGLVPMPNRLARWITDLGFFPFIHKTGLDQVMAYAVFCRWQEVDWTRVDLAEPIFPVWMVKGRGPRPETKVRKRA